MDPVLLTQRLETARRTFDTLERQLADPAVASDPSRLQAIARERSRLEPLVDDFAQFQRLELEREATRRLLKEQRLEPDGVEFAALAAEELVQPDRQIAELQRRLKTALSPRDPREEHSVMAEIRAGVGGDAAVLWAGDCARR